MGMLKHSALALAALSLVLFSASGCRDGGLAVGGQGGQRVREATRGTDGASLRGTAVAQTDASLPDVPTVTSAVDAKLAPDLALPQTYPDCGCPRVWGMGKGSSRFPDWVEIEFRDCTRATFSEFSSLWTLRRERWTG